MDAPAPEGATKVAETVTTEEVTVDATPAAKTHWLALFPTNAFTIVLGLTGLGLAWQANSTNAFLQSVLGYGLVALGTIAYVAILGTYLCKSIVHPQATRDDFDDPDASNFLPAASMGPMLIAGGIASIFPTIAEILWLAGASFHLVLALRQIRYWIIRNFEIKSTSPAWFIPISGSLLAPISGIEFGYVELSWSLFALGLGFWIALFVIVLNRIIFHDKLPAKYIPTLFLLMAPPSLAFMAYTQLNGGQIDTFSQFLYHFALVASVLVFSMAQLFQRLPFTLSWWAYTFPLDAIALASFVYADYQQSTTMLMIAYGLLTVASFIVLLVSVRTILALLSGTLITRND